MQPPWKFRYYVPVQGKCDVQERYLNGSAQLCAKFKSRLSTLKHLNFPIWTKAELAKTLHGECSGLVEIRFFADKVQQRPLGYVSGNGEFTILFWANEKGGKWVPKSACEIALKRKSEVLKDRSRVHDLWMALD